MGNGRSVASVVTVALLAITLAISARSERRVADTLERPLNDIPIALDDWRLSSTEDLPASVQNVLKASSYLSRRYTNGRTQLNLFIAYYAFQRAGESMHSPKNCLPGAGWEIWNHGSVDLPIHAKRVTINRYSIQNGPTRNVVLYWYQSRDRIIADEYKAKVLLVWDAITKARTAGSIVRITSLDQPGPSYEAEVFAKLIFREMQNCLGHNASASNPSPFFGRAHQPSSASERIAEFRSSL
jgi:EpsI family protein